MSVTMQTMNAAIVEPICGIRSSRPTMSARTIGDGASTSHGRDADDGAGDDRDDDVAQQREGDRAADLVDRPVDALGDGGRHERERRARAAPAC